MRLLYGGQAFLAAFLIIVFTVGNEFAHHVKKVLAALKRRLPLIVPPENILAHVVHRDVGSLHYFQVQVGARGMDEHLRACVNDACGRIGGCGVHIHVAARHRQAHSAAPRGLARSRDPGAAVIQAVRIVERHAGGVQVHGIVHTHQHVIAEGSVGRRFQPGGTAHDGHFRRRIVVIPLVDGRRPYIDERTVLGPGAEACIRRADGHILIHSDGHAIGHQGAAAGGYGTCGPGVAAVLGPAVGQRVRSQGAVIRELDHHGGIACSINGVMPLADLVVPRIIPTGQGQALLVGVQVIPLPGKDALAVELRIGQVENLAENFTRFLSNELALISRGAGGSLFHAALEADDGIAQLGSQYVIRQFKPALGRIAIGLILLGGADIIPGHEHTVHARRVIGRAVDLFLRRALFVTFHICRKALLHLPHHGIVHGALCYTNGHGNSLSIFSPEKHVSDYLKRPCTATDRPDGIAPGNGYA